MTRAFPPLHRHNRLGHPDDLRLGAPPIGREFGDGDDLQSVLVGEIDQLRAVRHFRAILSGDDLAEACRRPSPAEAGKVDRRLGDFPPLQHPVPGSLLRDNVTRPPEVRRVRPR